MRYKIIFYIEVIVILLSFGILFYFILDNGSNDINVNDEIEYLKQNLSNLNNINSELKEQITYTQDVNNNYLNEINELNKQLEIKEQTISRLNSNLLELKKDYNELSVEYNSIKPYSDRVLQGQYLGLYNQLLSDHNEYTKPIILNYLNLVEPKKPNSDVGLWIRAKSVYNWISDNYEYCGDKGLRVGNTFYEFQFFSPDELLMSNNHRCGDCDDFATLFAGMLYASGVSSEDVYVICGDVENGGHCWNWLRINGKYYRIDSVCSQKQEIFNLFGWTYDVQNTKFADTYQNIDCFTKYEPKLMINPKQYVKINE